MTQLNNNDIWASGITNPRPPDARFSTGFECSDADPNIFNYLFWLYGNAIVTLQNSVQSLAGTDISALRQALVRTDDKVAEHTTSLDSLNGRVARNEGLLQQLPSEIGRGPIAIATSQSLAAKGADDVSIATTLSTRKFFQQLVIAFNENRASGEETRLGSEGGKFTTPAGLDVRDSWRGDLAATLSRANSSSWERFNFTASPTAHPDPKDRTLSLSSPFKVKGMWVVEYEDDNTVDINKQVSFVVNFFEDFDASVNGGFPRTVTGSVDLDDGNDRLFWTVTIVRGNNVPISTTLRVRLLGTSSTDDITITQAARYKHLGQ